MNTVKAMRGINLAEY